MKFLLCLVVAITSQWVAHAAIKTARVEWDSTNGRFAVHDGNSTGSTVLAYGSFDNEIAKEGWSYLNIKTNSLNGFYMDYHQAYAAGLLEAYLTHDYIQMQYRNEYTDYCANNEVYCKKLDQFLNDNLKYMLQMAKEYSFTDPFWHHVGLTLVQLAGIESGMRLDDFYVYVGENLTPNVSSIMQLSLHGDLFDLEEVLGKVKERAPGAFSSCSGLIKLTDNNADLLTGHATWSGYNTMLRIQKKFSFQFHQTFNSTLPIPGQTAAFSSYPGRIISGDDFYVLSSGLVVSETTLENNNPALYQFTTTTTVPSWIRNTVANRLANSGLEWAQIYAYNNSGTYNNQWMVLDYKLFTPGSPIKTGLFHVLEQMPGHIHHEDMSPFLAQNGHWPSYNTAYFADIFNISGQWPLVKKYGNWYTYDKTPRALIFKRDNGKALDVDSLRRLLRYNDYTNDPLSKCKCTPPYSAENAISSRSDLNPINGVYPFSALGHRPRGGTDVKVTNSAMMKTFEMLIQCGPTNDQQPTFMWSRSDFNDIVRHEGHPDAFNFPPVHSRWAK